MACNCGCGTDKQRLLYSCSGSANTGYLADQVWRQLKQKNAGSGTCLAALGADLSGFLKSAEAAGENLVLDGCSVGCGKKIFENRGLACRQIVMTDYGVEKGKDEITPEIIGRVTGEILRTLESCS